MYTYYISGLFVYTSCVYCGLCLVGEVGGEVNEAEMTGSSSCSSPGQPSLS